MGAGQEPWASLTPEPEPYIPTHNFTYNRNLTDPQEPAQEGSEFGGVSNIIQPAPHLPTASERLAMIYHIDPSDSGEWPNSLTPPELEF